MRVIIKEPNQPPSAAEIAEGLDAAQGVVGGLIDVVRLAEGLDLVINEEGLSAGLELNIVIAGEVEPIPICGAVFFVGVDRAGNFVGLTDEQVATVSRLWVTSERFAVPVLRLPGGAA